MLMVEVTALRAYTNFLIARVPKVATAFSGSPLDAVSICLVRVTRGWVGGRRGGEGRGGGVGREEAKAPQVNTRGPELPTDGPDHTTRPKGHHSSQG